MNAVSENTLTSASSGAMPEADRNALLLASLRRLVRGLTALFWGLPAALVIGVQIIKGEWLRFGFLPITGATLLLLYGVWLLGGFQTQERVWTKALDRARYVIIVNVGLSPFLFFWAKIPSSLFFTISVELLFLTMLAFLFLLNSVLARLAAMLPDETLRGETKVFTRFNHVILLIIIPALPLYFFIRSAERLPRVVADVMLVLEQGGTLLVLMLLMFFILLPVAMTMAMLWKTKEVIMAGVFSSLGQVEPPPRS